jgi:prepilin-type N-terminal cleavage/methylation domain-containing protein
MKVRVSNSEKGFSLLEALVSLAILTVVILMLYELMIGSMKATMFVESRNDLELFAQRTVNAIQTAAIQSRKIHQENVLGQAYRNLLIASDLQWPIYPDSRLPIADPDTSAELDPDISTETFVGNEMLLVRALEPVPILYDHDADNTTDEIPFYVDRYRLEFYFLTLNSARNFNRSGSFLDLMKAKGPAFADYFQLSTTFPGLSAAQRTQIATGLAALVPPGGGAGPLTEMERVRMEIDGPITQAWDPAQDPTSAPPNNAFYDIDDATGNFSPAVVTALDLKKESMLPEFGGGRMSGKMEYSVATNSDTDIGGGRFGPLRIMDRVPLFGYKNINFPAGFEIKIIGPTGARSVWNRLVLCSENVRITGPGREIESQESVVISSAREY